MRQHIGDGFYRELLPRIRVNLLTSSDCDMKKEKYLSKVSLLKQD